MKDSKNLVIGLLCAVVCIMAVAYAAFSTTLTINGTATISSEWNVAITAIECKAESVEGGQAAAVTKDFNGTTAQFDMTFKQPGDSAYCDVTITNNGTIAAKVEKISVVATNAAGATGLTDDNIQYAVEGITEGTPLAPKGGDNTNTYKVTAEYVDVKVSQDSNDSKPLDANTKAKTLTVTIDYVQNFNAA